MPYQSKIGVRRASGSEIMPSAFLRPTMLGLAISSANAALNPLGTSLGRSVYVISISSRRA